MATIDGKFVPRFTGKSGPGQYWYRGRRWLGPTNAIGQRTQPSTTWRKATHGQDKGQTVAQNDGPFVHIPINPKKPAGPTGLVVRS